MPQKDVLYGFEVVGDLPTESDMRPSVLEDAVQRLQSGEAPEGQAVIIAKYRNRTAASAAANSLRKRHGQPNAKGFKFECHRDKESDRSALYAVFNSEWVTDEGQAQHAADIEADKAKKAEQARERRAKKIAEKDAAKEAAKTEKEVKSQETVADKPASKGKQAA